MSCSPEFTLGTGEQEQIAKRSQFLFSFPRCRTQTAGCSNSWDTCAFKLPYQAPVEAGSRAFWVSGQ